MKIKYISKPLIYLIYLIIAFSNHEVKANLNSKLKHYPYNIYTLGEIPDWSSLNKYHNTITRTEFESLFKNIYSQKNDLTNTIKISNQNIKIISSFHDKKTMEIAFRQNPLTKNNNIKKYWKSPNELPITLKDKPLKDLTIALDPGHIGGEFAQMEERFFTINTKTKSNNELAVMEGEMTLIVAYKIKHILATKGAEVRLIRATNKPITTKTPKDFLNNAKQILTEKALKNKSPLPTDKEIKKYAELLFYRVSEIRARGKIVNNKIKPDLVVCLHFNAEPWGDPNKLVLSSKNHLHFLINGCYSSNELSYDDQRFEMLNKLFQKTFYPEYLITNEIAKIYKKYTKLKPYKYVNNSARKINKNSYIWSRNLLANRIYECPVIYCEPYVMNNKNVITRIKEGDYKGLKKINGYDIEKLSIYNEYALFVATGIINYYKAFRRFKD